MPLLSSLQLNLTWAKMRVHVYHILATMQRGWLQCCVLSVFGNFYVRLLWYSHSLHLTAYFQTLEDDLMMVMLTQLWHKYSGTSGEGATRCMYYKWEFISMDYHASLCVAHPGPCIWARGGWTRVMWFWWISLFSNLFRHLTLSSVVLGSVVVPWAREASQG